MDTHQRETLSRTDVEAWRDEADAFFESVRRELACLTGDAVEPAAGQMVKEAAPSATQSPDAVADASDVHEDSHGADGDRLEALKQQIAAKLSALPETEG